MEERTSLCSDRALCALVLAAGMSSAGARDIEPRGDFNAPIGVNFLLSGYAYPRGGIL